MTVYTAPAISNTCTRGGPWMALSIVLLLTVSACATKRFESAPVDAAPFLERSVTQTQGDVSVTAAVPDGEETEALLGIDLYAQGVQPVWLKVENNGDRLLRLALLSVDREYYSPLEVAYINRKGYTKDARANMERWFYENQMPRRLLPGESGSGFIFTHLVRGTKGFNVDIYTTEQSLNFTFFVPVPGFRPDYMNVDFAGLYAGEETKEVEIDSLPSVLQSMPCCSTDESGSAGDPFNVVLVGTGLAVRRALLRAGWLETAADSPETVLARTHRYRGRQPDGTFHKSRPDGGERKELRLWLAPLRAGGEPAWIGQVSYDMSGATGEHAFEDYRIDPDIDDARMFIMQNFWYAQSLARMGFVGGVPPAAMEEPARNFADSEYFTDGLRVVLFVAENPIAMDETILLPWERLDE